MILDTLQPTHTGRNYDFHSKSTPLESDFQPVPQDVLCGRGNAYAHRRGNQVFAQILSEHVDQYHRATKRLDKSVAVATALSRVLATGARFVKYDRPTDTWFQLGEEAAHEKCGHGIRDMLRKQQQRQQLKNGNFGPKTKAVPKSKMAIEKNLRRSSRRLSMVLQLQEPLFEPQLSLGTEALLKEVFNTNRLDSLASFESGCSVPSNECHCMHETSLLEEAEEENFVPDLSMDFAARSFFEDSSSPIFDDLFEVLSAFDGESLEGLLP